MISLLSLAILLISRAHAPAQMFTDAERLDVHAYWSAPGRYAVALPPDAAVKGAWQVRLTVEGSVWLLKYQNALGAKGVAPTVDPTSLSSDHAQWQSWVQARIAADRRAAQSAADTANAALRPTANGPAAPPPASGQASAPDAGPIPATLLATVGDPPRFAAAVTPMQHSITFDDGETYAFTDHVQAPRAYAYYRSAQGVAVFGSPAADADLDSVFKAAGMTDSEQRIARAVSKLEGSFESINTYDTGYVSVGFIQFITLDDGRHSLCDVMRQEKRDSPEAFAADFHRFGIDVTDDGAIDVVDPATCAELTGPDAVRKLVEDKRLIAVFQRAGRHSMSFRIAQVKVAKARYWPADDAITIMLNGRTITGKVSDVIRSEAGMATLFDRKVNRGSCEPISSVVTKLMIDRSLNTLEDAAAYEREIVAALKYRGDFLNDSTLQQP